MERIGKYQNLTPLARGGSGQLYKAFDSYLGQHVAIKVLLATDDQRQLKRFRDEARTAAKLSHRNVVKFFDAGIQDGRPYLVMELLEGEDLATRLQGGGRLSLFEAVEVMHQVAIGLDHAHKTGVIHRDVTPQNIWLLPDGTAKIIDFGFARDLLDTQGSWHRDPGGTLHYMSPEHISNEELDESAAAIDARSDIFSFGSVFYQLISGVFPFTGDDERSVILSIQLKEATPVLTLSPECPDSLAAIIHRCLQKEPKERFQSFRKVLSALEPIVSRLRRDRAQQFVEEALSRLEAGDLDAAELLSGNAISLAEDFELAHDAHGQIQAALEVRATQRALEAKLIEAQETLSKEDFPTAIRLLEQLPKSDPAVIELLGKAHACSLIHDARRCFEAQEFEEALDAVNKALERDEGNTAAIQLQQRIRAEVERRNQERLEEALRDARKLLKDTDYLAALVLLEPMEHDFRSSKDLQALLNYARAEVKRRRLKFVQQSTIETVRTLAAYDQFSSALELVDQALQEYPHDPVLEKLKTDTLATMSSQAASYAPAESFPCRECGRMLPLGARFCDDCGKPITP